MCCIDFPKGVIKIVHGYGATAGAAIVEKSDIISFTGGTETGKIIASTAAKVLKVFS